mmetsp:Transcript_52777/g.125631  ORF Transcript_52777/g.125631 Transcript_52777/m.125631 type:complete len:258 (-) Transcript_52777:207-980(-)
MRAIRSLRFALYSPMRTASLAACSSSSGVFGTPPSGSTSPWPASLRCSWRTPLRPATCASLTPCSMSILQRSNAASCSSLSCATTSSRSVRRASSRMALFVASAVSASRRSTLMLSACDLSCQTMPLSTERTKKIRHLLRQSIRIFWKRSSFGTSVCVSLSSFPLCAKTWGNLSGAAWKAADDHPPWLPSLPGAPFLLPSLPFLLCQLPALLGCTGGFPCGSDGNRENALSFGGVCPFPEAVGDGSWVWIGGGTPPD